jgi:hypothetical protein
MQDPCTKLPHPHYSLVKGMELDFVASPCSVCFGVHKISRNTENLISLHPQAIKGELGESGYITIVPSHTPLGDANQT